MKRITVAILLAVFLCIFLMPAQAQTFYKEQKTEPIASGITHTYMNAYTSAGWQKIHIIEADLSNPHVTADVLTHKSGTGYAANLKTLAQQDDSTVAVNADFFARNAWDKASPLGMIIKNGTLLSDVSTQMNGATIGFDNQNNILIQYIKTTTTLTAQNGSSVKIGAVNKYDSLKEPAIYTNAFSEVTGGSMDNILEIVVTDGVVTDIRRNLEGVKLQDNQYVIRHLPEYDPFLLENVSLSDTVTLQTEASIDIHALNSACGGGTLLMENGKKPAFTHSVNGTNPRTIAGTDATGKKLYLITVDGRASDAAGLTMTGAQELAEELGLYTAINLDGGGSTTMVVKNTLTGSHDVVNSPSDSSLRTIPIGIQLKSDAPNGASKTLCLQTSDNKMFAGSTRTFSVDYAIDTNGNKLQPPKDAISWQCDGGTFEGNVFHAQKSGKYTVYAKTKTATGSIDIQILDAPVSLSVSPMSVKQEQSYTVSGTDRNGHSAKIENVDLKKVLHEGYTLLSFGDAECALYLTPDHLAADFEAKNVATAYGYPTDTAKASYQQTTQHAIGGSYGGQLSYSFSNAQTTHAAYLQLSTPQEIPDTAKYLSMFVYTPYENHQWLRAEGVDADGKPVRITLCESMDFSGLKHISVPIPPEMKALTKLYVVQNKNRLAAEGIVIFDNIFFAPESTSYPVYQTHSVEKTFENPDFSLTISAETGNARNLLTPLYDIARGKKINALAPNHKIALGRALDDEKNTSVFQTIEQHENGIIILAASTQTGITGADSSQWQKINQFLQNTNAQNIFVCLPIAIDTLANRQGEVLKKILEQYTQKNIYVFYPDKCNQTKRQNGIVYTSVSGLKYINGRVLKLQKPHMSFAHITVSNGEVAIAFENILPEDDRND